MLYSMISKYCTTVLLYYLLVSTQMFKLLVELASSFKEAKLPVLYTEHLTVQCFFVLH